jgi:hypothetical protein
MLQCKMCGPHIFMYKNTSYMKHHTHVPNRLQTYTSESRNRNSDIRPIQKKSPRILKRRGYVIVPKFLERKPQIPRFGFEDSRNPRILGVDLWWNFIECRHFPCACFVCDPDPNADPGIPLGTSVIDN